MIHDKAQKETGSGTTHGAAATAKLMKNPTNLSTTFGRLPIFGCGAVIVGAFADAARFPALDEMLGIDAAALRSAMGGKPVAMVESRAPAAQYDYLIGLAEGKLEHLPAALELAEQAQCRGIAIAACGVYELTAQAARNYASAGTDIALAGEAHRLYQQAVDTAPRAVASLRAALASFIAQIGHVQWIDVVTSITGSNDISPQFAALDDL